MKTHHHYLFALELLKQGAGTPLGRVPVTADWEPAAEAARWLALRRFPAAAGAAAVAEFRPAWHPRLGEPWVDGFQVLLQIPGVGEVSCPVSNRYFKSLAVAASSPLVQQGSLKAGEQFDYLVTAYPATPPPPGNAQRRPRLAVEEVPTTLPLRASSLGDFLARAFSPGGHHEEDIPVFIPQAVLREAEEMTRVAGAVETASVLIGHLHRDLAGGDLFLEVTAQIPARNPQATATQVTFGPETWDAVHAAVALRGENEQMVGWFHSHPAAAWCNPKCSPGRSARCSAASSRRMTATFTGPCFPPRSTSPCWSPAPMRGCNGRFFPGATA